MPSAVEKELQVKEAQRAASKRATFDRLAKKKRAEREISLELDGDEVTVLFRAIGAKEYDDLLAKHPPSAKQKLDGATYNMETFAPALISKVCADPEMTEEEAKAIWTSEEWSRGEVMTLFANAVELCNQGLNIPFTATA